MSGTGKGATSRRTTTLCAIKNFGVGVGPRQFRCVASDGSLDRMGDVLDPFGAQLANFKRNPVVLAQHDQGAPIARCVSIGVEGNQVLALVEFPPEGISPKADEYCRLVKAGIISAVSVGFIPIEWKPISGAGNWFTSWELLELSLVSVPANQSALITERSVSRGIPDHGLLEHARAAQRRLTAPVARCEAGIMPSLRPEAWTKDEMWKRAQELKKRHRTPAFNSFDAMVSAERVVAMMYW